MYLSLFLSLGNDGLHHHHLRCHRCHHHRLSLSLSLLLPSSCFCPAPAVLLPCSLQAPILHIPSSSPVPAQLPSFCPVLLYSALLLPYSCPAPALLMLQPRPCFAPALLLVLPTPVWQPSSSSSAPNDFFWHGESRLLW